MIEYKKNTLSNIFLIFGLILLFLYTETLLAQEASILDKNISYKAKNITLHKALTEIGSIVGYNFSYNSDLIPGNSNIKVSHNEVSLSSLLNHLLQDSSLIYKVLDKQIVITKRNQLNKLMFIKPDGKSINHINIRGKILDHESKTELSFANISVKGKSIGTVSNEQGKFNINISRDLISDTLVFSYIGYKNTYIPIEQLSLCENLVYLSSDKYKIKEVVVRGYDAKEILREATNKIKDNYYTDPYQITAFYRELVIKGSELSTITEAVLNVYKSPYLGSYSDRIKLLKGRKNEYYSNSDTVALKLKGGLFASLYLDLIKNPQYFVREKYFSLYKYSVDEIINYDNQPVYVINFEPTTYIEDNSFQGKIYINTDCLSIVAVEFNITPGAIDRIGKNMVVKKTFNTRVKPVAVKYLVNFRKINNKYFLNFVKGELQFKVKYRRKLFSTDFKTVFEFASNVVDTVNVERFKRNEVISKHKIFIDENYDYDYQFWGEYNYISPEKSLQESLIEIQKKIDKLGE